MKNPIKLAFLLATVAAATLATSQAAVIVWGSPTTLSSYDAPDPLAVDTTGTLHAAKKFGDPGDFTVNGVTFSAAETDISISADGFKSGYGTPLNPFATMLMTGNLAIDTPQTLTLSGLTSGYVYSIQVFTPVWNNAGFPLTLTAGNAVTLQPGFTGGPTPSQYAIGTFTADATTQTIALTSPTSTWWTISAAQVRLTAIPEPTSFVMLLGGLGAMALLRRRRTA